MKRSICMTFGILITLGLGVLVDAIPSASAASQATAPQSYAAVAFSPSLKALREGFGSSAADAETVALNACLRYAAANESSYYKDCAVYEWVRNGWVAFASSGRAPRQLDWAWGAKFGATSAVAAAAAVSNCEAWGGGKPGEAACIQVGGSPFRSPSYDPSAPTTGGPSTLNWTTAPLPPVNLTATAISSSTIRLTWEDPTSSEMTGASGYEINNGVVSRYAQNNATSWDWGNLNPGTYMCFKVRAFNGVGDSWWAPNQSPWYVCATTPSGGVG